MYIAEVEDTTGGVGTAVHTTTSLIRAVRWVAEVTRERWAGAWRIKTDDGALLLGGAS